ncbi:protein adenylyltransferase SelO [Paenibacillus sp. CAU 1782]
MADKIQQDSGWDWDNTYGKLPSFLYTRMEPAAVQNPAIAILNAPLAASMGLDAAKLGDEDGIAVLAGNVVPEGADPLAQAYAGHQFGYFNRLGDGRALLLGEHVTPDGRRLDIQLKGSGRTPYSRSGDGRAALGPMLREYIISEAMYGLGIPTTRSLAVVTTGQEIVRESYLPGAVLTRIAASHIRVGTFQYAAQWGKAEDVGELAVYTLHRHYPNAGMEGSPALLLLKEAIARQAELIARWMLVGFVHGVMNTDNMAISGESIDYGPCAFLDTYDPDTVFSSIDSEGRYAYRNQPSIAAWNLARFAETLLPLLDSDREAAIVIAQEEVRRFEEQYREHWLRGMRAKLGLFGAESGDEEMAQKLLDLMSEQKADYTETFRLLTLGRPEGTALAGTPAFADWLEAWDSRKKRQERTAEDSFELMKQSNPSVIPRNHRVEEALEAAEENGDYSVLERLLAVLANPFAYTAEQEAYGPAQDGSCGRYVTYCGT